MWGEKETKQQTKGLRPDPMPLPASASVQQEGGKRASTDKVGQTRPAVQRSET